MAGEWTSNQPTTSGIPLRSSIQYQVFHPSQFAGRLTARPATENGQTSSVEQLFTMYTIRNMIYVKLNTTYEIRNVAKKWFKKYSFLTIFA
jgi:hypothetical protein